ncbi:DUF6063 family protein [Paenibacillus sp. IHBB 10380]|uniref:DUF6063 family protein n=1 Tax=Paenibacillus sp. IHBB 10380 TaxID=1566358 RepID=UPI0005CFE87B|nr:DUF6063 family protein [Paenibacillus sp. IHBB 10380]AJS61178.1 hypothetical protein UB51_25165 [Paenibacillus sp. IHBB 10380]
MSYSLEQLQQASRLFFELLRKKVIPLDDPVVAECLQDAGAYDALKYVAKEGGCRVMNSGHRIHLLVNPLGSVFATNFTQLKNKYSRIERKTHLHTINIIILVFLAEIDQDETNFKSGQDSMSYIQIADQVSSLFQAWFQMDVDGRFSGQWQLDIQAMYKVWSSLYMQTKSQEESDLLSRGSNSRIGLIHEGMKLLEEEKLVLISDTEKRIFPREELYERMRYLYHDVDRYQELKGLIGRTLAEKDGGTDATD